MNCAASLPSQIMPAYLLIICSTVAVARIRAYKI
jgi:hypothetical protein